MPASINFYSGQINSYSIYTPKPMRSTFDRSAADAQIISNNAILGLAKLLKTLDELENNVAFSKKKTGQTTTNIASDNLDLYTGPSTVTTLRSSEDMNAFYTSYTPTQPAWQGISSSTVTLSGVYDGSNGSGALDIVVRQGGIREFTALELDIVLPNGGGTQTLATDPADPVTTIYTLSNGIGLSIGAGALTADDTASASLNVSTTESVRPDKPFNGTGNEGPHFENGQVVNAGSFEINGTTISVSATDSINSVISRISNSAAGVTATLDMDTETILLSQNTPGSAYDITLANDTSGFLSATKLAGASAVAGLDNELEAPLNQVSRLSQIQSGSFTIDNASIPLNTSTDSLNSVLARFNENSPNVTASITSPSQQILLTPVRTPVAITLASGSTQLFPALGIADGRYELSDRPIVSAASKKRSYRAANLIKTFQAQLTDAHRLMKQSSQADTLRLEGDFKAALKLIDDRFDTRRLQAMGLEFRSLEEGLLVHDAVTRRRLTKALQKNNSLEHILLGKSEQKTGLLEILRNTLVDFIKRQNPTGSLGSIIDQYV